MYVYSVICIHRIIAYVSLYFDTYLFVYVCVHILYIWTIYIEMCIYNDSFAPSSASVRKRRCFS